MNKREENVNWNVFDLTGENFLYFGRESHNSFNLQHTMVLERMFGFIPVKIIPSSSTRFFWCSYCSSHLQYSFLFLFSSLYLFIFFLIRLQTTIFYILLTVRPVLVHSTLFKEAVKRIKKYLVTFILSVQQEVFLFCNFLSARYSYAEGRNYKPILKFFLLGHCQHTSYFEASITRGTGLCCVCFRRTYCFHLHYASK